jgi:signal transduction histidine kinase
MNGRADHASAGTRPRTAERRALPWGAALVVPCAAVAGALLGAGTWPWLLAAGSALAGLLAARVFEGGDRVEAERGDAVRGGAAIAASPAAETESMLLRRAMEIRCTERTAVLDALGDGVLLVDAHGETLYANRTAVAMLGESACTGGTRGAIEALPPQAARAVLGVIAGRGGDRRRVECDLRDARDGRETPVVVHATPLGDDGRTAIVVRDVRAEREADAMKSEFVQKASHELRTPLSNVRAYAEMLQDGEAQDEAQRATFVATILNESQRLADLVDDMLDIGRIESGVARPALVELDLAQLASECVDEMRGFALQRGVSLAVARTCAGAVASADRGMLKRVVLNLLSNALKYTPSGGSVRVEVDVDSLARSVVFSVRDTGLGIPAHAIPRLFGKFYRVEQHERVAKGTGLGLNLCRNIVETVHGGQIGVESEQGAGSRFWFAIPIEQAGRKAA